MRRKSHNQILIILLVLAFIIAVPMQTMSYASNSDLESLIDVEEAIRNGTLTSEDYAAFENIAESSYDPVLYRTYLRAIKSIYNSHYIQALDALDQAQKLAQDSENKFMEMLILEKSIDINKTLGRRIEYQEQAIRLNELSGEDNPQLYAKSLIAIARSHFNSYNDETAREYLSALRQVSEKANYELGLAMYYDLTGDLAFSYEQYDEAIASYQKAYEHALQADQVIAYPYAEYFQIEIADVEFELENYQNALDRLLEIDIESLTPSPIFLRRYYYDIAEISIELEQYEDALVYLNQATKHDEHVSVIEGVYSLKADIYSLYGYAYNGVKNHEKATEYFIKHFETEVDYVSDADYSEAVSALSEYETRELEKELALKSELKEAKERTIQLQNRYLLFGVLLIGVLIAYSISLIRMNTVKDKMKQKLYLESITDHMTNIFNRNHIIKLLENNIGDDICILLADIDNFKEINDTFGHVFGDQVLIRVAETLKKALRPEDYVGRYGGEEFLILLNNVDIKTAYDIAERIRSAVDNLEWDKDVHTTLSMGLLQGYKTDSDVLLHEVDVLMYQAKNSGKNKVIY